MRRVLLGLAVVASLATSLIGPSGLGSTPAVAEFAASREQNAWADAHLAAEKAAASWWRSGGLGYDPWSGERNQGVLVEQVLNGIPGDAVYPVPGHGWSMETLDGTPEVVWYVCDANYDHALSGGCVPADRDYDCGELRSWGIASIPVVGEDWMLLDDNGDGWGCEPVVTVPAAQPAVLIAEPANPCDGVVGMLGCLLPG